MDVKRVKDNSDNVYVSITEKNKNYKVNLKYYIGKSYFAERILSEVENRYVGIFLPEGNGGLKGLVKLTEKRMDKAVDLETENCQLYGCESFFSSSVEVEDAMLHYHFGTACAGCDGTIDIDFAYKTQKDTMKIVNQISRFEVDKLIPLHYEVAHNFVDDMALKQE